MLSLPRTSSFLRALSAAAVTAALVATPAAAETLRGPAAKDTADERPNLIAVYDGLRLLEPTDEALAIGFHEAGGTHPAMKPVGRMLQNENPATTDKVATRSYPDIRVLPSRGRGGPATSAIDVALAPGEDVRAPVTGTVTGVHHYALYGEHEDVFIEITPKKRPDLRVLVYHVEDVAVAVGDTVKAGKTVIAGGARELAVANQIDRYADDCPCPHVDLRVRDLSATDA